jgi:hypothetical protein
VSIQCASSLTHPREPLNLFPRSNDPKRRFYSLSFPVFSASYGTSNSQCNVRSSRYIGTPVTGFDDGHALTPTQSARLFLSSSEVTFEYCERSIASPSSEPHSVATARRRATLSFLLLSYCSASQPLVFPLFSWRSVATSLSSFSVRIVE